MILRKRFILTTIAILIVLLFIADSNSMEKDRKYISDKKYLLVIDSDLISCSLCLQSFTKFIEVINANGFEKSVLGVLIIDTEEDELNSERWTEMAYSVI